MSSQSNPTAGYSIPFTRDSSDYTRTVRERITYVENKPSTAVANKTNESSWLYYGNGFRLSYLYGKTKCTSCTGNAFGTNGPYVNNVGGISAS